MHVGVLFFFQAEDGIRDADVTGVQTCALPISSRQGEAATRWRDAVSGADRWLACDPLSEEATRLAMEAHYLDRDCGAALGRFAAYRARLARDIGAQPGAAGVELGQRIESETPPAGRTPPPEVANPRPPF